MTDGFERRLRQVLSQASDGPHVAPDVVGVRSRVRRRRVGAAAALCGLLAVSTGGALLLRPAEEGEQQRLAAGPSAAGQLLPPPSSATTTTSAGTTTTVGSGSAPAGRMLAQGVISTPGGPRRWALSYGADVTEFIDLTIDGEPCGYRFYLVDDTAVRGKTGTAAIRDLRVGCRVGGTAIVVGVLAPDVSSLTVITDRGSFEARATPEEKYPDGYRYAALAVPEAAGVGAANVRRAGPTSEAAGVVELG